MSVKYTMNIFLHFMAVLNHNIERLQRKDLEKRTNQNSPEKQQKKLLFIDLL